jgi:drug/metabolite transporter (DMT)-like permease
MGTQERTRAVLSITVATIFWGTTYPVIKFGLREMHLAPLAFLTLRFTAAVLSLLPLLFVKRIRRELLWSLPRFPILLLGTLNGIAYTLQFSGQVFTTSGVATIMINTYILFTLLFGRIFLGKKINRKQKLAVLLGFLGVVVIAMGDLIHFKGGETSPCGVALTLCAGVCAGLYVTFSEKVYELRYGDGRLSPVSIFFSSTVYSITLILLADLLLKGFPRASSMSMIHLFPVLYLGILCTSGSFILYLIAVRDVGAVNTAVFMLLQIVVSILASFLLLGEVPNLFMILGAPLIFLAIYLTS